MDATGKKPGIGIFECGECGKKIILEEKEDLLPQCQNCGDTEWDRVFFMIC